jgi:hypothetical protein
MAAALAGLLAGLCTNIRWRRTLASMARLDTIVLIAVQAFSTYLAT